MYLVQMQVVVLLAIHGEGLICTSCAADVDHAGELHVHVFIQVVVLLVFQAEGALSFGIWSEFVPFEPSNSNLV